MRIPRLIVALGLLVLADGSAPAAEAPRPVRLSAEVRYYYGRWQWGGFSLAPQAGMAGPQLRLELLGGKLAAGAAYLSGDFTGVGATALDDARFHSRKEFDLADNREQFTLSLEYRPWAYGGVVVVWRLARYDLDAAVQLISDQRHYGSGREQAHNEARGLGLGLRPLVPLVGRLALQGEALYFPGLQNEAAGRYQYQVVYREEALDERWFGRTKVRGLAGQAELVYTLQAVPAQLAAGFFYQHLRSRHLPPAGWLEDYLRGQTGDHNWLRDRFYGFTARAAFRF
ncbi:MAG: hypothetical protein IT369_15410 [Candidatus Latescibacteria bacterium]|nr:hypothetical protein [Candidatus Latescibacterota bacterium]